MLIYSPVITYVAVVFYGRVINVSTSCSVNQYPWYKTQQTRKGSGI